MSRSLDRRRLLLALALLLATVVVYLPTFHSGYVDYDDPTYLINNPRIPQGLTLDNLRWSFETIIQANWHPLTWVSYFLDAQLFGRNLMGFHATSVLIHAVNAALLFLLLAAATEYEWRSLMVAALFALHPLNVESVAWLSERKSVLSLFFSLLAVLAYGWYVRNPRAWRYLVVTIAFVASLLAKSMAVSVPLLLLLIDYWPLRRYEPESRWLRFRRLFVEKIPLFAVSAIFSGIAIYTQRHEGAMRMLARIPLHLRMENAALATVVYFRRLFWPNDLAYYYPHPGYAISLPHVAAAVVFLVALAIFAWRFRSHRPLVFGLLFFAISILPVIGIVQIGLQSMADRYAYVPFIGLFIALVWELADLGIRFRVSPLALGLASVAVLAGFSACTVQDESYWHDSVALFTRDHQVVSMPNLYNETNLADALLRRGDLSGALVHLRHAQAIAPNDFGTHFNVAFVLARMGNIPGTIKELQAALRCPMTDEQRGRGLYSLGNAYEAAGDHKQAIETFQRLLALDPTNPDVKRRLDEIEKTK